MTLARLPICAEWIEHDYKDYTILDVGCRDMQLKRLLKNYQTYTGADLVPGEGVIEVDLEQDLPMDDNAFDIVTALDVLEHLDKPHQALHELIRVARKAVFVSLPNMYYIQFRLNFLLGKGISGKYAFPTKPILDRHRWVMSYSETLVFVRANSNGFNVKHKAILPIRGRTKIVSEPIEKFLARAWPDLFVYGALFKIELE